jgi:four helix bundle protein
MEQATERQITFFRFEDLRIYHKALDYATWVHNAVLNFPVENTNGLDNKFVQTAHSIALNIAEGSARNKGQFVYYLKLAKSAVRECLVLTSVCNNLGIIDSMQEDESRNSLMEMTKMLGALVTSLQKNMQGYHNYNED